MKTNVIKKAVSVLACASILAGCTAMSNAAGGTGDPQYWFGLYSKNVSLDVASKKSKDMFTYRNNDYDYFNCYENPMKYPFLCLCVQLFLHNGQTVEFFAFMKGAQVIIDDKMSLLKIIKKSHI